MPRRAEPPAEEPTFETLYTQLEDLARRLEQGGLGLEESIALYERGATLVEQLRAVLAAAEERVQRVRDRLDGRATPGGGEP